jgi:acetyl esterase/lipase
VALLAGCADAIDSSPAASPSVSTTTTQATTTTTVPVSTTTTRPVTTTTTTTTASTTTTTETGEFRDVETEVLVPDGSGPFPAVVLVHGGGWVAGTPSLMSDLARFLTGEGFLTVNTAYTLSGDFAGYPMAVDDVACAVRYAAAHPSGDGTVAIAGHSAGAHLGALAALDPESYGADCSLTDPVVPERFVGLAGPYDVSRLGPFMLPFFGVSPSEDPELWRDGNPMYQVDGNPGLSSLIMHGEDDGFVDLSFATDFADALTGAGSEALVEVVEAARHNDMDDPVFVGDLIATWLQR